MDNFSSDFKSDLSDLCLSWCQTLKITFFCDMIPCNLVVGSHSVVEELPAVISEVKKGKAVPLQAWSGPEGSRKLRFPDFMTMAQDGGKVVSLMHWPPLPPGKTSGTRFCQRLSRPQGHSATSRIMSLKNSNDTIGNRTRDLAVCSVVP